MKGTVVTATQALQEILRAGDIQSIGIGILCLDETEYLAAVDALHDAAVAAGYRDMPAAYEEYMFSGTDITGILAAANRAPPGGHMSYGTAEERAERNARIIAAYRAGVRQAIIAKREGIPMATVRSIIAAARRTGKLMMVPHRGRAAFPSAVRRWLLLIGHSWCRECHLAKPLEEFSPGLRRICRGCNRLLCLQWREDNPEVWREIEQRRHARLRARRAAQQAERAAKSE